MKNYLAIDYGEKNIGIAYKIGDNPIVPSDIIKNDSIKQVIQKISEIIVAKEITQLVVGMPYTLRGETGPQAEVVGKFIARLQKYTSIPIDTIDERFTSQIFTEGLDNFDSYSAGEILNSYLLRKKI
jgi:putative Holliday junction resolvase